ncbi:MAG TPA: aspartate--tRNA ligase [Candidatus Krumholzibacteria bacterium]|nr:aspartate--tRNA ligase [Candidatus Krumholzibacteria bacterium]
MKGLRRSHTCGELTPAQAGHEVTLNGWVASRRDHGGLVFVDLRDRYGVTQVVFGPQDEAMHVKAQSLRQEDVVALKGSVRARPDDMVNPQMQTGGIEVVAEQLELLNRCAVLPFQPEHIEGAGEELILKYRYLHLRMPEMQHNLRIRHEVARATREFLSDEGFLEVETPLLIQTTPEGARDYVVPSRVHPGKFYALPQSPQLYKQTLMISGVDRYFQLARCLRDEDLRADRQPEHTQIDIEMSFVDEELIYALVEGLMSSIVGRALGREIQTPFPRLSFDEAMDVYGSDKPDLRFELPLVDLSEQAAAGGFKVFSRVVEEGGRVKVVVAPSLATSSRKDIAELEEIARKYGAKGLAYLKWTEEGLSGSFAKFFESAALQELAEDAGARPGDLVLFVADKRSRANRVLGQLRLEIAERLGLRKAEDFEFCWVHDFPLFEQDEESGGWTAMHHMFTMPREQNLAALESDPGSVYARLYDLVCNGMELGSGSIRINQRELQESVLSVCGISKDEARRKFGWFLRALEYGAPPHGGIALGLDRIVTMLVGGKSIREVIAFPKTTIAANPLDGAPSNISARQLAELSLKLTVPAQNESENGTNSA